MYEYRAEVIRVVDGDTLALMVDLGCDVRVALTVRLNGINCPERGTPQGNDATDYVRAWRDAYAYETLEGSYWVDLHTIKDKREKFGRYLGNIYAGGRHLNEDLVVAGHAVRYYP